MSETSATGLISGGLDSTVVAAYMQRSYDKSYFLFCEYGQKTAPREREAFADLCAYYQPDRAEVVDMTWLRAVGQSALFEAATSLNQENRQSEYVPFRNASLLSAAVAFSETVGADAVLIGSTASDTICPDNSPAFITAYQKVIEEGTKTKKALRLVTPLLRLDKKGVIELGTELNAPFELSWSCHNNSSDIACGHCSNCEVRRQAFIDLGQTDPLTYE